MTPPVCPFPAPPQQWADVTIPDPPTGRTHLAGGEGSPARDVSGGASRAGVSCWLCGLAITDPPHIIGQYVAGTYRVAHRHCWQTLGALDLNLPFPGDAA